METSSKRSRDEDSDSSYGSDLISRSPSPDYTHEAPEEKPAVAQSSLETAISGGIGFKLLQQMGWKAGSGLGKEGQGRVDPIRAQESGIKLGLGKYSRDIKMLDSTTLNKKSMASLKMANESEADRIERESRVAQKQAVKDEISETLKAFFCEMCNKGPYANIGQYNNHLDSYDHAHVKRTKALQAANKKAKHASGEIEKRNERERKREEKEMLKLTGGKPAPSTSNQSMMASLPVPSTTEVKPVKKGFMKVSTDNKGTWVSASKPPASSSSHSYAQPTTSQHSAIPPPPYSRVQPMPPPPSTSHSALSPPSSAHDRPYISAPVSQMPHTTTSGPSQSHGRVPVKSTSMGFKSIAKKPAMSMDEEQEETTPLKTAPRLPAQQSNPAQTSLRPMNIGFKPTAKKAPISMDDEEDEIMLLGQKKVQPAKGGMKIGKIGFKP